MQQHPDPMSESFDAIPIISLAGWTSPGADRAAFAEALCDVCHRIGFLVLTDHGIDDEFLDRYFDALTAFFALPEEVKATIDKRHSPHFRGWERVGAELTDNRTDFREQLDLSTENPLRADDSGPAYLHLDGPNQWLPDDALPGFRDLVLEFYARAARVADQLMAALSLGLGLGEDHLRIAFGEHPLSLMKLIRYPPTPAGEAGVNAHHDAGFLTVLAQHGVPGLQALNPAGEWIDVPPVAGTLAINLGEMLQSMSGNYFVATKHRVITSQERVSSAYFHGPDLRTSLAPLPLSARFVEAVAASPRHAGAGFMAQREALLAGLSGTTGAAVSTYGEQLWNYYRRSYPDNVRTHYPHLVGAG